MDPPCTAWPSPAGRLPRTRGDGPGWGCQCRLERSASPHTRGWTRGDPGQHAAVVGFPAHAGMDRRVRIDIVASQRLPRTRGDGPRPDRRASSSAAASPHTRGWTHPRGLGALVGRGFPAHAGMDPSSRRRATASRRLPRTRGDGPDGSPSMTRWYWASPHTRGWTAPSREDPWPHVGFPAHAGMDPCAPTPRTTPDRLPRTRGDGPPPPGMEPLLEWASPHTRGWTHPDRRAGAARHGFPAHAGMDPWWWCRPRPPPGLPRTRGDGPRRAISWDWHEQASPHTRGWTAGGAARHLALLGFPAHAGMDPSRRGGGSPTGGLPRTRGDGPALPDRGGHGGRASPHTRGWTLPLLLADAPVVAAT